MHRQRTSYSGVCEVNLFRRRGSAGDIIFICSLLPGSGDFQFPADFPGDLCSSENTARDNSWLGGAVLHHHCGKQRSEQDFFFILDLGEGGSF